MTTIFDIIGPQIIGPSSSHTAGACSIGFLARKIHSGEIKSVHFELFNSFAKTGKGHGTELALLGGIMGFYPDNENIKNSFTLAQDKGVEFSFSYKQDYNMHPNAVYIEMFSYDNKKTIVFGTSLGGGKICINKINGCNFNLDGQYPTLVLIYKDSPGMVYRVANLILNQNVNIASMHCDRDSKGHTASMGIALDDKIPQCVIDTLEKNPDIYFIRELDKLRNDF